MAINFVKLLGCATLIWVFIVSDFHNVSAIRCYQCRGYEACQNDKLGKNGSIWDDSIETKKERTHGIEECNASDDDHAGSEFCFAKPGRRGYVGRGCGAVGKALEFDPSKIQMDCPIEEGTTKDGAFRTGLKNSCFCFTDLCNGETTGCCPYPVTKDYTYSEKIEDYYFYP